MWKPVYFKSGPTPNSRRSPWRGFRRQTPTWAIAAFAGWCLWCLVLSRPRGGHLASRLTPTGLALTTYSSSMPPRERSSRRSVATRPTSQNQRGRASCRALGVLALAFSAAACSSSTPTATPSPSAPRSSTSGTLIRIFNETPDPIDVQPAAAAPVQVACRQHGDFPGSSSTAPLHVVVRRPAGDVVVLDRVFPPGSQSVVVVSRTGVAAVLPISAPSYGPTYVGPCATATGTP